MEYTLFIVSTLKPNLTPCASETKRIWVKGKEKVAELMGMDEKLPESEESKRKISQITCSFLPSHVLVLR
jgi:hypothetical protein